MLTKENRFHFIQGVSLIGGCTRRSLVAAVATHAILPVCWGFGGSHDSQGLWIDYFQVKRGHVDQGEDDFQTALRETEEEAGLKSKHFNVHEGFKKEINYNVKNVPKTVIYWLAELKDNNVEIKLSKEHQMFCWLNVDEACKRVQYQEMQEALREAYQFISTKTSENK